MPIQIKILSLSKNLILLIMKCKKPFSEERYLSHVYRVDDDVMHDVREFILKFASENRSYIPFDIQMSISDFLTVTKVPYRSKSRVYEVQK